MRTEREHYVTMVVAVIALLVIFGGFASFTGLSVQEDSLMIEIAKSSFRNSDVFDAAILLSPVTFMADDSVMVYVDSEAIGVIALKKYLDDNELEYGTEVKNLGQNNMEIMTLKYPVKISLADFLDLEYMRSGTTHILRVEFSKGDAFAEEVFRVE